jgi:hypothetical protein
MSTDAQDPTGPPLRPHEVTYGAALDGVTELLRPTRGCGRPRSGD